MQENKRKRKRLARTLGEAKQFSLTLHSVVVRILVRILCQCFPTKALEKPLPLPLAASPRRCSRLACIAHPPAETRKRFRRKLAALAKRRRSRRCLLRQRAWFRRNGAGR